MQNRNIFYGLEIVILITTLTLTACGGGGGDTSSTPPSSTTAGSTGSGGGGSGGGTASSTYTLSWGPVTGTATTVTGYRVYYGTAPFTSQSPLGTINTTVSSIDFAPANYNIAPGTTLYMAVSTLGVNGVESPASQTLSVVVQ